MIDPSFVDKGYFTMEVPLSNNLPAIQEAKIEELEHKIDQLNNALASMTADRDFWQGKAHERKLMIDNLEEYIKEQYDYIDEEVIQSLVDIFGLEVTKDYDVQVTITFSGTVTAPLGYDMDELENALEARLDTSYYSGDVVVDFMEDNMDIDWRES
jgi:chromosome segregation ATPase